MERRRSCKDTGKKGCRKGRMDRMVVREKGFWKGKCIRELMERRMSCKDRYWKEQWLLERETG